MLVPYIVYDVTMVTRPLYCSTTDPKWNGNDCWAKQGCGRFFVVLSEVVFGHFFCLAFGKYMDAGGIFFIRLHKINKLFLKQHFGLRKLGCGGNFLFFFWG